MIVALALVAAACAPIEEGDPAQTTTEDDSADNDTASSDVTRGGTLQVGRLPDIASPDGHVMGAVNHSITNLVYDRLIAYDPGFEPRFMLAESMEANEDATQFTLGLREGLTFHDGSPITSETIQFNLERVADPEGVAVQLQGLAGAVSSIETPDDLTIVVRFDAPTPGATDLFNMMAIVDPATIDDVENGLDQELVTNGSGPFKFAEWAQGERIVLERFDDYWDEANIPLDGIEFQVLGDPGAMAVQLEAGAIDVAEFVRPEDAARLDQAGFGTVVHTADMYYVAANVTSPPLDDVRVRQAINHAIDRERFATEVLAGLVEPTTLAWPPDSPAHDDADAARYEFDLDRAQELLDEAGVDGLTLELVTNAAQAPLTDLGQILQSDLSQIGVEIDVQVTEVPQWRELAFSATYGNLIAGPYGAGWLPAYQFLFSRPLTHDNNFSNYQSDEYRELIETAVRVADPDELEGALANLREFLLDEAFIFPIAPNPVVAVHAAEVSGLATRQGGGFDFTRVSLGE